MTREERELIQSLFDRLDPAAAQPKDPEADALIASRVSANRAAPYLLTQMAIVHEHALQGAQNRIAELEQEVAAAKAGADRPSSFLGGLLAGSAWTRKDQPSASSPGAGSVPSAGSPPGAIKMPGQPMLANDPRPFGGATAAGSVPTAGAQYGRGPSFLQSAISTAAGVAGGMVLGHMLSNMLFHNPGSPVAQAAATTVPPPSAPASRDEAAPSPWSTAKEDAPAAASEEPAHEEQAHEEHAPEELGSDHIDTAQNDPSDDGLFDAGGDFGGDNGGGNDFA